MTILIEKSRVNEISRAEAVGKLVRVLDTHDYAEVGLNIQIRINGNIRTITVTRSSPSIDDVPSCGSENDYRRAVQPSSPGIAIDPAELWEEWLAETDKKYRTPQSAMAFAVDRLRSAAQASPEPPLAKLLKEVDPGLADILTDNAAYVRVIRGNVIEECAKVLDRAAQDWHRIRDPGMANNAKSYAKEIRALAVSSTDRTSEFLAPITEPTIYFEGQDELVKTLRNVGLDERDMITTVHLVARALQKARSGAPAARAALSAQAAPDRKGAAVAAQAICDYTDNNLTAMEAFDMNIHKARELHEAATRLRDMLAPAHQSAPPVRAPHNIGERDPMPDSGGAGTSELGKLQAGTPSPEDGRR